MESAEDIEQIELRPEYLVLKTLKHRDLATFLPYPVVIDDAVVTLDRSINALTIKAPIDKSWDDAAPDVGSAPWLLAQALRTDDSTSTIETPSMSVSNEKVTKPSLLEMFHLETQKAEEEIQEQLRSRPTTQWDPVDEDEELPEDRFHRRDMMSMHILEQRKKERAQKTKDADAKRLAKRAEVEEKRRKAREAGKTWREMYPDEPETTYIDMEDILAEEKRKRQQRNDEQHASSSTCDPLASIATTDTARRVAAAWSEDKATHGLSLSSALAFDLLE
ncbi:hypothetical protein PINS_up011400 [Pythium insidiosum]|nr:hypothetical protein PINS_up011400 [Pythium insidiosum]